MNRLKLGRTFLGQASVLKRLIAFLIDILIINFIILFPFERIFDSVIPKTESFSEIVVSFQKIQTIYYFVYVLEFPKILLSGSSQ